MKNKIRNYTTKALWIMIAIGFLFIAGTFLSPEVKGETMTTVQAEYSPKNKELRAYQRM